MEEGFNEAKTEAPTQHRREDARQLGQVARSADLSSCLVLLAGMIFLAVGGAVLGRQILTGVQDGLGRFGFYPDVGPADVQELLGGAFRQGLAIAGVLMAVTFVAAFGAGMVQVGFQITPGVLAINWERVSPANGMSRLLGGGATLRGVLAVVKVVLVIGLVYWLAGRHLAALVGAPDASLVETIGRAWSKILQLGLAIALALVLVSAIDYGWQRWRHEQSLRMSRPELKEELKREEGNPQVKLRVRKLQREAAQKRMMRDVPRASVVITNPTHLAVALRYDRLLMAAPCVVAKGSGLVAERIVALARRHAVVVVERKPLAQALFRTVRIGQEIPLGLYHLVAEVLAYVYRLRDQSAA